MGNRRSDFGGVHGFGRVFYFESIAWDEKALVGLDRVGSVCILGLYVDGGRRKRSGTLVTSR
jgi:hypothetical protein